eukprot:gene5538-5774_t
MLRGINLPMKHDDLSTGAVGLLVLWGCYSIAAEVANSASVRNSRAAIAAVGRWLLLAGQVTVLLVLWLGVVATMLGMLCELVLLPLRLPPNQTALIYLYQDWTMGVLVLKLWHLMVMVTPRRGQDPPDPNSWQAHFEAVQAGGLRNLQFKRALTKIVLPMMIQLGTGLSAPYVLSRGVLPLLRPPAEVLQYADLYAHLECGDRQWAACPTNYLCYRQDKYYHQCREDRSLPLELRAYLQKRQQADASGLVRPIRNAPSIPAIRPKLAPTGTSNMEPSAAIESNALEVLDITDELDATENLPSTDAAPQGPPTLTLTLEFLGIDTAAFAEAYAAGSLEAVSEATGVSQNNIITYLKALPAEASSSARKLKQESPASAGVGAVYELYSQSPAMTAAAVSKAVANNGELLHRALEDRNIPYRPAILLNGDRVVEGQAPSAEPNTAAAIPVTPVPVAAPLTAASKASGAHQTQQMEWWKQAAIGIGAAVGAILIISAAAIGAVLYKRQQMQKEASGSDWDTVSLTQRPDVPVVEQQHLSTAGYITSETPRRLGNLIQQMNRRIDSFKGDADNSYVISKQPYSRSFLDRVPSMEEPSAAGSVKAAEIMGSDAPTSKPAADAMEKGALGNDIQAVDASSGVVASFMTAFNAWKRAANCSGRGGVKTLTMDEYDAYSVSCDESCTPTSQHSVDSEKAEQKTLPWLRSGTVTLTPDLLTHSIFSLSSEGSTSTGSIQLGPIKESEDSEVDTMSLSSVEEEDVLLPVPVPTSGPQLQSPSTASMDTSPAKTTNDSSCQLDPPQELMTDAGKDDIAIIKQTTMYRDIMRSLMTRDKKTAVHMSGRSLTVRLNDSTELLVHVADGDCQWSLRTVKRLQDSNW